MENTKRKQAADYILYECGLLDELKKYGAPHIIGSYRMDMMAWNDLDIDIENDAMSLERLHELSAYIIKVFQPTWYEAKEETTPEGKTVWFHGFETYITGELWNVDLWFFDKPTIDAAEAFCDKITATATQKQKDTIIEIKQELLAHGLYSFEQYSSMDVYKAVLEENVQDAQEFFAKQDTGCYK